MIGKTINATEYIYLGKVVCPIYRYGVVSRHIEHNDTYVVIYGTLLNGYRVNYKASELKNKPID